MNAYIRILGVCIALTLTGCGGGGNSGGSSQNDPVVIVPPADAVAGGHWFGTVTNDLTTVTEEYFAMVDENGRFRLVSVDSAVQMSGNFTTAINDLTGNATAFADTGAMWQDGSSATAITIVGTITERNAMSGSWTAASGETGSFEFFYDPMFYERAPQLSQLAGSWTGYDDNLNPVVTFTIASDGSFTGQNVMGCNSMGQFTIIDPGFNLFEVQSTITGCFVAGDYTGLAFLADLFAPNDALAFAIDDGTRATVIGFEK